MDFKKLAEQYKDELLDNVLPFWLNKSQDKEKGYTMVEDAGRGYRQVVPSPKPFDIVEAESIKALFNAGHVVIAVGGGGIPVVRKDGKVYGTPAVIDKDFGSELLAELLDADVLVILTAVEKVAINFNKPDQKGLDDHDCALRRGRYSCIQWLRGSGSIDRNPYGREQHYKWGRRQHWGV